MAMEKSARKHVGLLVTFLLIDVASVVVLDMLPKNVEFWAALGSATLLSLAVWLTMPGGPLQRRTEGVSRLQEIAAVGMLLIYIVGSVFAANGSVIVATVTVGFLAAATVMLMWPALRSEVEVDGVLFGVAFLLVGVAFLLLGVAALLRGDALLGVAFLLVGVAVLLLGVAALLRGDALRGMAFLLVGVVSLLVGVAALLLGVAALLRGDVLLGVAFLLLGVATMVGGVAFGFGWGPVRSWAAGLRDWLHRPRPRAGEAIAAEEALTQKSVIHDDKPRRAL